MDAVVSLSGGIDSATVLAHVLQKETEVRAIGFAYGSKHNEYENKAARAVAEFYGVPFDLVDLSAIGALLKSDLLKSGGNIPEGHYEAESMKATVVPARNMIFASVLAGVAESCGAREVWLGVHAGDHHIYPDCRPDFFFAMWLAVLRGTDKKVSLRAPYLQLTKGEVVFRGLALGVPYNLTRTCYKDQSVACGRCGSCQERLEAFAENKVEDPLQYEEMT
jgi:7-cyano-7-deazaguanine synthase